MFETATKPGKPQQKPAKRPRQYVSKSKGTIRCADCGDDFRNDIEFQEHECALGLFDQLDYVVGSNL